MPANAYEKSFTLKIFSMTFLELEMLSIATERNLGDLYVEAVRKYISECKPDRLKAFAAPGAGKRIRVNIDHELYYALIKKNGNSCVNTKDVVHPELEYYLDHTLKAIAA